MDTVNRPAQRDRSIAQGVLTLATLRVLEHLTQRGLANVQECITPQMIGVDFLMCVNRHASPPSVFAEPCWQVNGRVRDRRGPSEQRPSAVDESPDPAGPTSAMRAPGACR